MSEESGSHIHKNQSTQRSIFEFLVVLDAQFASRFDTN